TSGVEYTAPEVLDDLPVGRIRIDSSMEAVFDQVQCLLGSTEFTTDVITELRSDWSEGSGFADSFARSLLRLLGRYGLVIIDPLEHSFKRMAAPLYARAVAKADEIVADIRRRSDE